MATFTSREAWNILNGQPDPAPDVYTVSDGVRTALEDFASQNPDALMPLEELFPDAGTAEEVMEAAFDYMDGTPLIARFVKAADKADIHDMDDVEGLVNTLHNLIDGDKSLQEYKAGRAAAARKPARAERHYDPVRAHAEVDRAFEQNWERLGLEDRSNGPSGFRHPTGKRPGGAPIAAAK